MTYQINELILVNSLQTNFSCDSKLFSWGTVQLRRPKPNVARITGWVELRKAIGQDYSLRILISRKGSRFAFQDIEENVCTYMAEMRHPWWVEVLPKRAQCPIAKGRYLVVNFFVNDKVFTDGSYTLDVALNRGFHTVCRAFVELSVLQRNETKIKD
ncbi:hypothetical protein pipiens_008405 [Culex pipiens pipiens]|uniref:Uncharacterized protein n=1 Tax=Culex pipiens pipiens TaxID=38569 RepID=A0ABD1DHJ1_CULPP